MRGNKQGQMVRLGTVMSVRDTSGTGDGDAAPQRLMYSAAAVDHRATRRRAPGSAQAIELMEQVAKKELQCQSDVRFEWTELAYLQNQAGNTAMWFFALAVVFVFLVLAAQYESWKLPLAVILVVPMCLLCSIVGVQLGGIEVSIFTQIGFVVLVGLACKNAILIVEFAKQQMEAGGECRCAVSDRRSDATALAADRHDLIRLHFRRGPTCLRHWRRR